MSRYRENPVPSENTVIFDPPADLPRACPDCGGQNLHMKKCPLTDRPPASGEPSSAFDDAPMRVKRCVTHHACDCVEWRLFQYEKAEARATLDLADVAGLLQEEGMTAERAWAVAAAIGEEHDRDNAEPLSQQKEQDR